MNPYSVLLKPLVTEKSNKAREDKAQYSFQICLDAGKEDVKSALSKLYDVKVDKVRTMITRGKYRRRGMYLSKRPKRTKKAVVTLAKGQTLKIFED